MNKATILCVDDEKTVLDSLKEQLLDHFEHQYNIETAEGGHEALEVFEELLEEHYDIPLVISDCIMPDMKGDELLKRIHAISPQTLKIMLTGQTSTEAVVNAVNHAKLYRYISKPWEKEDLVLTASEAIKSYFKDQHIEEQNKKLKKMNAELQGRTQELSQVLEHLKATQQELVQSEKMAALGQLIAGIAHEINTPLGAIQSSVGNISKVLSQTLMKLPDFFDSLSLQQRQDFLALLQRSIQQSISLSAKEERKIKKALIQQLKNYPIEEAPIIADTLVDMRIYSEIEAFLSLLTVADTPVILQTAYKLSSLQKSTQNIETATTRTSKIIFALKHYAHSEQLDEMVPINLIEGIETVLTIYHNQIKPGIEVIKNYSQLSAIMGYPDELNQVWTNLLHNALYAIGNQGTLHIDVQMKNSQQVLVNFADSGVGIPQEIQEKIFEPFFTTKPSGEGSGLGLNIVKKIIEKHQGNIIVESVPGKTIFEICLPIIATSN